MCRFTTIIGIVVLLILSAIYGPPLMFSSDTSFDAAQWKADSRNGGSRARARMVESLRKDFLKAGMSYAEVEDLLGEPDERTDDEYYKIGSRFYSYGAGYSYSYNGSIGFGLHHDVFVVEFTPSGEAAGFFMVQRKR